MIRIILSKCILSSIDISHILVNIHVVLVILEMKLKGTIFDTSQIWLLLFAIFYSGSSTINCYVIFFRRVVIRYFFSHNHLINALIGSI